MSTSMRRAMGIVLCGAMGCYAGVEHEDRGTRGSAADDDAVHDSDGEGPPSGGEETPTLATRSGLRRLSVAEYDNALRDLVGDDSRPASQFLPADALTPFDNDHDTQAPSEALVLGAEKLASDAADSLLGDTARLEALVGCSPADAADTACLVEFVTRFGRRALRRPLSGDEVAAFSSLHGLGVEQGDWHVAAAAVVRAMLQAPAFLYRVEIGEPIEDAPGIVRLDDFEVATRLSFFLWGTIPDDALLDIAAADGLSTADDVRVRAEAMLGDPRARAAVARVHALWLGYSALPDEGLAADMLRESNALVDRVVFEDEQPWLALLTSRETFLTPDLAEHYGLPAIDRARWVDLDGTGRGGILGHGTVLALGAKFDDTSPTTRGLELRERLLCERIEIPPDLNVNSDDPPGLDPEACKWDRYAAHREVGVCAGCHALLDGLGFGLENYDATGAFRSHDVDKPECVIAGDGEVAGVGSFNGPAELGALLAEMPAARACATKQLYRFVAGRREVDALDEAFLETLGDGDELRPLMVEIAASEAFRFRVVEEG